MNREPDWEALSELNFLLNHRITQPLNAALSAIDLAEMPEYAGHSAKWWRDRARTKITTVLNLFTAWSWLVQYKAGMDIPEQAIRPFSLQSLLEWLTVHLQLVPALTAEENPLLYGNQETLQEAILLLYSVASTLGSGARVMLEAAANQVKIRIRYARLRQTENRLSSVEELLISLGKHWRMQVIRFELKVARDFLELNRCLLELNDTGETVEFSLPISYIGVKATSENEGLRKESAVQSRSQTPKIAAESAADTSPLITKAYLPDTATKKSTQTYKQAAWHIPAHFAVTIPKKTPAISKSPAIIPVNPTHTGSWHLPHSHHVALHAGPTPPPTIKSNGNGVISEADETPIVLSVALPDIDLPDYLKDKLGVTKTPS